MIEYPMLYLKQVRYKLPNINKEFIADFLNFLSPVGEVHRGEITLKQSNNAFFPFTGTFAGFATGYFSFLHAGGALDLGSSLAFRISLMMSSRRAAARKVCCSVMLV